MSDTNDNLGELSTSSEAGRVEMERVGGGPWGEDKQFPRSDWQHEVANSDTTLGYFEWLSVQRLEAAEDEESVLVSPSGKEIVGRRSQAFAIEYGRCIQRNGKIEFDFTGDEEIDWNASEEGGEVVRGFVYLDAEGGRWLDSDLVPTDASTH